MGSHKVCLRLAMFAVSVLLSNSISAQWSGVKIVQIIPRIDRSYSINLANSNNDQFIDLIVAGTHDFTQTQIYLGNGDGTFSDLKILEKDVNYRIFETGDINNDGIDDLIISGYFNNNFKLFWGNMDGVYSPGHHYNLTGHGRNVKAVDLNKDGALDVAVLSAGSGQPITLHVYMGNNSQDLFIKGVYPSLVDTDHQMILVDKNQDGLVDIMVATLTPFFVIFYQQVDGSFIPRYWPYELGNPFTSHYLLADLNNNKIEDVVAFYKGEGFRFYEGLQDTLFSEHFFSKPSTLYPLNIIGNDIKIKDVNNDGFVDILMTHFEGSSFASNLYCFLGMGDFSFSDPLLIPFPSAIENFMLGDINNDSLPDIVASCKDVGLVVAINIEPVTAIGQDVALFDIYPNPFTGQVSIKKEVRKPTSIYTNLGQLIYESTSNEVTNLTINTASWSAGIYIVKCGSLVKKIIKF
ncbi:MAG: T9SS C-terminal target domain-containing protein [Cytophagia bacterium]|nr:T9SS C-terminal target domain-containing protein [Cytophagia bacterium]